MPLSARMTELEQRLERFERRVEAAFDTVDKRFDTVDKRFDIVDKRFDELRRHFDVIAEASRDDFRNLYDLVQAHMVHTDARIGTVADDLRAEMKLGYTALDTRVTALERGKRRRNPRS